MIGSPVTVIAEIGCNHQNDLSIARQLIDAAKVAGATVVKFQASTVDEEVSRLAAPEHYALLKRIVPTPAFLKACAAMCAEVGIEFLCTPAGLDSLKLVLDLGVKRIKVASDNLTNWPFLEAVKETGLPAIISTGMSDDIPQHIWTLWPGWDSVILLHCVSAYPTPLADANLSMITTMREGSAKPVGWSDHTKSTTLAAVAVGMGAVMIEKHITLDRNAEGPDHRASLEPDQFAEMVRNIREAEAAMGDGVKRLMPSEEATAQVVRKSLVAASAIRSGEPLTAANLTIKRPGTGIPASRWGEWLTKTADRDYQQDELIA